MKNLIAVIGGSSGIGYAICNKLKDEYKIVNMSRRESDIVDNIFCDVTDSEIVTNAFNELKDNYGIPYGIIYCSGYVEVQNIYEITEEALLQTFQVNILGCFRVVQEYLKINKSEGKIILIASTAGMRANPGWDVYSSSKSGIINFASTLSEELKSHGIEVYCVSPGRVATELRQKLAPSEDQSKIMQPETVADFIYQLIKDEGYLSNQNIIIKKNIIK